MELKDLTTLLNEIITCQIVFSNETDFQFYMASKIKDLPSVKNIEFEALSFDLPWQTIKNSPANVRRKEKQYTDLLVRFKDSDACVAIELKYKLSTKPCIYTFNGKEKITMAQGAYDIGAYSFIKDIKRLKDLIDGNRHLIGETKVEKGYSIMLTNETNYRNNNLKGKSGIWQNYAISEESVINNKKLNFVVNGIDEAEYNGFKSIDLSSLSSKIKPEWHPKKTSNNNNKDEYSFDYLIVEVC